MNKIYRIVQYIQPWEIDDFERQINQLIKSSYDIEIPKNVVLDVTLNVDVVNWLNSSMCKEYFIHKFRYIEKKANIHFTTEFDLDNTIKGCTDKRRSAQNKIHDYIVWLDSDVYFPTSLLPYMIIATQNIITNDFIVSPQLIRYWDSSWDILTNEKYINEPHNHRDYFDSFKLDHDCQSLQTMIIHNDTGIKFGGGWFNLFTQSVFNKIPIPDEIGSYGPDDTYISVCSGHLNIQQFILSGQVVSEVGKLYESNYIRPNLDIKISDKEKISDSQLYELIHTFINSKQSYDIIYNT